MCLLMIFYAISIKNTYSLCWETCAWYHCYWRITIIQQYILSRHDFLHPIFLTKCQSTLLDVIDDDLLCYFDQNVNQHIYTCLIMIFYVFLIEFSVNILSHPHSRENWNKLFRSIPIADIWFHLFLANQMIFVNVCQLQTMIIFRLFWFLFGGLICLRLPFDQVGIENEGAERSPIIMYHWDPEI